ncbi:MAG: FtsX-like permease family protein [Ardenticatenaceae bacterium]|nr:FtsX-like permease family protein [Ardenticatenaceae bacterium]
MILKYVWKNFSRRKIRTVLMVLSLLVSTALIVAMSATVESVKQSNIDLVASAVGRFDISVRKTDTSPDPFINVAETTAVIQSADARVTAVYPRFQSQVELEIGADVSQGWLVGLDPARDDIGYIDVVTGTYTLGDGQVALLEDTANTYDIGLGDTLYVAYSFPQPREAGKAGATGASARRVRIPFTVAAIVRQEGVIGNGIREGLIADIGDVQRWLELPGRAETLLTIVDPSLYESQNAEIGALNVRGVAQAIQAKLGDEYTYSLDKAVALDDLAQAFLLVQALINMYGLMALGVVGLLVHTLVMTNVQEQRRDMAILRILGGQRNFLFTLVIAEVAVIGLVGIGLGIIGGNLVTQYIVLPLINQQMLSQGLNPDFHLQVTAATILPAVLSAAFVLFVSTLKPAQDAAKTKVVYAINPSVADNIQLEDLAHLRERGPNLKIFGLGWLLMLGFGLIAGGQVMSTFGSPALEAAFIFSALMLMVLGVGMIFFIFTIPLEKLSLFLMGLLMPRLTYFARRNVGRGQLRNTLISMLVLFSGVLPTFLATQSALSYANLETDVRLRLGAPLDVESQGQYASGEEAKDFWLRPDFLTEQLATVPGVAQMVGVSHPFASRAADSVDMRSAPVTVMGVTGDLNDVLYQDTMEFVAGGPAALAAILAEPDAVIISEGLAEHLAVPLGGIVRLQGEGLDHTVEARVVGIARRMPGFGGIGRARTTAQYGSDVLLSLDSFRSLTTDLQMPLPPARDPILTRVLATLTPDADAEAVQSEIGQRYGRQYGLWSRMAEVQLESARRGQAQERIFLLALTGISFTTAVFGVFAVIYVTIYARRLEIGMMKAFGMRTWELSGMLVIEAIAMTLGAALAGIVAGTTMAYIFTVGEKALQQQPYKLAVDTTVMPFIVIMVVLASMVGAAFSARRIVKRKAIEILRM